MKLQIMKFKPLTIINGSPVQVYMNDRLKCAPKTVNTIYSEAILVTLAKQHNHMTQILIWIPRLKTFGSAMNETG